MVKKLKGYGFVHFTTDMAVIRLLSEPKKLVFKNKELDIKWRVVKSAEENLPMEELQELCLRAVGRHFQKIGLAPEEPILPPPGMPPLPGMPGMPGLPPMVPPGAPPPLGLAKGPDFGGKGKDKGKGPDGKKGEPKGGRGNAD